MRNLLTAIEKLAACKHEGVTSTIWFQQGTLGVETCYDCHAQREHAKPNAEKGRMMPWRGEWKMAPLVEDLVGIYRAMRDELSIDVGQQVQRLEQEAETIAAARPVQASAVLELVRRMGGLIVAILANANEVDSGRARERAVLEAFFAWAEKNSDKPIPAGASIAVHAFLVRDDLTPPAPAANENEVH